ncbi:hypothetical protein [Acinetobacter venetianus]|uniref:hypothetical protein n=1 Tax=Acinetobacter venetianus TaxID=52133 RepID=UPI00241F360B|nr:hypothetical protein [Acinetobacter venetianus]
MADKQYKALKPVGRFKKGDFVAGLSDKQISNLLEIKVIEEVKQDQEAEKEIPSVEVKPTPKQKEVKVNG